MRGPWGRKTGISVGLIGRANLPVAIDTAQRRVPGLGINQDIVLY